MQGHGCRSADGPIGSRLARFSSRFTPTSHHSHTRAVLYGHSGASPARAGATPEKTMRSPSSPLALCYTAAPIRFGDFELSVATRSLRRQRRLVSVEPKVFVLLQYLIEHRER